MDPPRREATLHPSMAFLLSPVIRSPTITTVIVMAMKIVEMAAMDGSNCHSRYVMMRMGSVTVSDPMRYMETTTLSNEVMNVKRN